MRQPLGVRTLLALAAAVLPLTAACADESASSRADPARSAASSPVEAPGDCVPSGDATRASVEGTPVWARLCRGPDGRTAPAEVPPDALTTHLDLLSGLTVPADGRQRREDCRASSGRTYRLQVGYADGEVAQVSGRTDPGCPGTLLGSGDDVAGPEGFGVYGVAMAAFGRQYADAFDEVAPDRPLRCPADPQKPDTVDVDGASAGLVTGYRYGRPHPMVMPLTAVRGIVCTWQHDGTGPAVRELTADEAERVRIGMHAIWEAMVDCAGSQEPTYTAVVEDETGTRRAVTVADSACSTVVRSDGGFGVGFAWLDR